MAPGKLDITLNITHFQNNGGCFNSAIPYIKLSKQLG